jgi:hypothetical protein
LGHPKTRSQQNVEWIEAYGCEEVGSSEGCCNPEGCPDAQGAQAWFMLQRIRYAMHTGSVNRMSGTVEADETFIGGAARFMHRHKRDETIHGRGSGGKEIIFGLLESKTGRVHIEHVETRAASRNLPPSSKSTFAGVPT